MQYVTVQSVLSSNITEMWSELFRDLKIVFSVTLEELNINLSVFHNLNSCCTLEGVQPIVKLELSSFEW